ncbi:hypothetical protein M0R72_07530 [Candidatus Pacearchaeota archaeon]|nr:hypothetical protein [Candidatus Pacearchaeota archaeon]
MMAFRTIQPEETNRAYRDGEEAARQHDGDPSKCRNPYGARTVRGKAWTRGWNDWVSRQFS